MTCETNMGIQILEVSKEDLLSMKWRCMTHADADGIVSAWICKSIDILSRLKFPKEFGDYKEEPCDLMLDMRPIDNKFNGIVIDHHLDHPKERQYRLVWGYVPTSLLCYELFKDKIPEDELWKVAIGIAGDGQPEHIPLEIINKFPELFYSDIYFGWKDEYSILLCFRASSLINACCRLNNPTQAFTRLDKAKTLMDLLDDQVLKNSIEELRRLRSQVEKKMKVIRGARAIYIEIETPAKLEGVIAQSIMDKKDMTVICLNKETGNFSIRGYLALWYCKEVISQIEGVTCGGHAKFVGGKIMPSRYFNFRKQIMKFL